MRAYRTAYGWGAAAESSSALPRPSHLDIHTRLAPMGLPSWEDEVVWTEKHQHRALKPSPPLGSETIAKSDRGSPFRALMNKIVALLHSVEKT